MNKTGKAVAVVVALVAATGVIIAQGEDPFEVLRRSVLARETVDYSGLRTVVLFENGERVHGVLQQMHCQAPHRVRILVLSPEEEAGKLYLVNGNTQWEYDPAQQRAVRGRLPSPEQRLRRRINELTRLARSTRLQYCGIETVAGRPAHVVKVYTLEGLPLKKTWIDVEYFVPLKTQRFDSAGRVRTSAFFTRINFNPTFPPGIFDFTPPEGCSVVEASRAPQYMTLAEAERRVGFSAVLPSYLPPGYHFEEERVAVITVCGRTALWLSFSNGVDAFSLFQRQGGGPDDPIRRGRSITWKAGGYCFTLLGPLSADEMRRVKASIRP